LSRHGETRYSRPLAGFLAGAILCLEPHGADFPSMPLRSRWVHLQAIFCIKKA